MLIRTAAALSALAPCLALAGDPIVSQPTTTDDANVGLGWYSNAEPRVRKNFKHADDFILSAPAEVGRVVWWGQSSLHTFEDLTNFDSFQFEFFEAELVGDQWMPGALLATQTIDIAETNPTPTGRLTPAGAIEYRHEATLTSPVALDADTRYFIAISAGLIATDSASDAWQWQDADLYNGWSASYSWRDGIWSGFQDTDSAFELYAVPTPSTVIPLCAALPVLASRRRR